MIRSGIEHLVRGVRMYLTEVGILAAVGVGPRALTSQLNQGPGRANRIVFLTYDPDSRSAGMLAEPYMVGPRDIEDDSDPPLRVSTVRPLVDWQRDLIVSVWAYDGNLREDDLAQEIALESLIEATVRAVHYTGFATVEWGAQKAVTQGEPRFGRENRIALRLTHPIFDMPSEVGPVGFTIDKGE